MINWYIIQKLMYVVVIISSALTIAHMTGYYNNPVGEFLVAALT